MSAAKVFPEGGNFTPGRQVRAIARLCRRGLPEAANRASRLHHVIPPRPAGVFAVIDAALDADVVFVAHTGLDHMESVADVWHAVPRTGPVEATWWTIPAARIPSDPDARPRRLQDKLGRSRGLDRPAPDRQPARCAEGGTAVGRLVRASVTACRAAKAA